MAISAAAIAKAAATLLTNEKTRKGVGWLLVAILSPLILIAVVLCSLGTGTADHNNHAVKASFYGASYSDEIPVEYKVHVDDMRTAFSLLDSSVASVNANAADGIGLDPIRVKAVFMLSALAKMHLHAEQPIVLSSASIQRKPEHAQSL